MHKALHTRDDGNRLCISRKKDEQDLTVFKIVSMRRNNDRVEDDSNINRSWSTWNSPQ